MRVYRELEHCHLEGSVASGKGPYGTDAPPGPVASSTMSSRVGDTGAVVSTTDIVNVSRHYVIMIIGYCTGNRGKSIYCEVTGDAGVQRTGTLPSTRSVASGKGPYGTMLHQDR